jgi:hypothetical protein
MAVGKDRFEGEEIEPTCPERRQIGGDEDFQEEPLRIIPEPADLPTVQKDEGHPAESDARGAHDLAPSGSREASMKC